MKNIITFVFLALASAAQAQPDWTDRQDYSFVERGFVATRAEPQILDRQGRVVWDLSAFDFLEDQAPATVNASLWRQSQLLRWHGLFNVTEGVWQVRGFDTANVTFIAGKTGWIVIDPLRSTEVAKAALALTNAQLGARPVVAVIYTHSHSDHFGGAGGVVAQSDVDSGRVQMIAPVGFLEHALSENVAAIAGPSPSLPRELLSKVDKASRMLVFLLGGFGRLAPVPASEQALFNPLLLKGHHGTSRAWNYAERPVLLSVPRRCRDRGSGEAISNCFTYAINPGGGAAQVDLRNEQCIVATQTFNISTRRKSKHQRDREADHAT
ncbi:MAG: hypothetical protein APF78_05270 [Sphingomonadales bacterium BRH_c3]|nr:MAG: hypothetical protein APF78_05270 [Sphingomonadales bacterium BRH_c3]